MQPLYYHIKRPNYSSMSKNPKIASRNIIETLELNVIENKMEIAGWFKILIEIELKYCILSRCKPHINKTNIKKRLAFAKK